MPAEYLLLVSLGPVQDFIASARRCQKMHDAACRGTAQMPGLPRTVAGRPTGTLRRNLSTQTRV